MLKYADLFTNIWDTSTINNQSYVFNDKPSRLLYVLPGQMDKKRLIVAILKS